MVVIYAKRFEDLPLIRRVGDVIRIHRANIRSYKDLKQFNVNVFYNSSWCLFSTIDSADDGSDMMDLDEENMNNDHSGDDQEMEDAQNNNRS
jgi:hypothetical protein